MNWKKLEKNTKTVDKNGKSLQDVCVMPHFSSNSKKHLATCDERLKEIMNRAIKVYDFSVLCGFRNEADQNYAYDNGFSKVKWPNSKHNNHPSLAVDVAPYPIIWSDPVRFTELAIIIKSIANELCIPITWGGDWSRFIDLPHWEVKK